MTKPANLAVNTGPDGRILTSAPDPEGYKLHTLDVPGELGALLARHNYRGRLVVERADGGAITPHDKAVLADAVAAVEKRGWVDPAIDLDVASAHMARARDAKRAAKDSK